MRKDCAHTDDIACLSASIRLRNQSKIYVIRGQRVMLDFDLAAMYGVETRYRRHSA